MSFSSHTVRAAVAALLVLSAADVRAQAAPPMQAEQQYTILIFERAEDLAKRTDARSADAYWAAYDNFAAKLAQAGALRGGSALSETTTVRTRGNGGADEGVRGAKLGGYFVIAAPSLAVARALAVEAPSFAVTVEIRPHRENPHMAAMQAPARP